jgi:predicted phosphodiesterase
MHLAHAMHINQIRLSNRIKVKEDLLSNAIKSALVIPDCHIPFEDKRAYQIMLEVAQDQNISEIVILGDYVDFYDVSSHPKSPIIKEKLKHELEQCHARLLELKDLFPRAKIVYICGNHENRLDRYIEKNAPALFGQVTIKSVLKLDELGIEFIPYGRNQKYKILDSNLYARHEPIAGGEHAAAGTIKRANKSVVFGHTHRIQEFQMKDMDGHHHIGINLGSLIQIEHPVFDYIKSHDQWAHGFGFVYTLPCGEFFHNIVHIKNYQAIYNGVFYSA